MSTVRDTRFNDRVPVRIVVQDDSTLGCSVDAWDPDTIIQIDDPQIAPADVAGQLASTGESVVEAMVDLGAERPEDVLGELAKALRVPSDEEVGF